MNNLAALSMTFALLLPAASQTPPAAPVDCAMHFAFANPDNQGKDLLSVWHDSDGRSLLFGDRLHVNTDGTKRSYKLSDFWGKQDALNNPCNAMSDNCAGLDPAGLTARREVTQRAGATGWPADLLAQSRLSPDIIAFHRKDGRMVPCDPVDGFLVSATSLQDGSVADPCDLHRYVDALTVSAVVIPKRGGFIDHGAAPGDLAVAMLPDGRVFYAVVGDTGPVNELGEGSIALNGALLGRTQPPANYDEIRGRIPGKPGWDVPKAFVLVLAKTRKTGGRPYFTQPEIDVAAKAEFDRWGGPARLRACAAAYRPEPLSQR